MRKHRTPEGLPEHAHIDQIVLELMLDIDRQRPLSEDEIARTIGTPQDARDSLRRLHSAKLIHRWNDLAIASHPAVRHHEINHNADDPSPGELVERRWDKTVLEDLLVRATDDEGPCSEQQTHEAFGASTHKQNPDVTDALDRLDAAGLIDRSDGRAIPSDIARCLDDLMTL